MNVDVLHRGGAVKALSRLYRLKDLLPADALQDGRLRITAAELEDRALRLSLDDGTEVTTALPPAETTTETTTEATAETEATLIVRNAAQVLTMEGDHGVGLVEHGAVVCSGHRVLGVVPEDTAMTAFPLGQQHAVVDAQGGIVTPGLVDPHTHPVFGGERSVEFGMKAEGRSYLEIHKAGGGILSTVRSTREASFTTLAQRCAKNLSHLLSWGVTTCEAKSGYDLTLEGELRMLEVLRTVGDCHPVDVVATLLGAHTLPPEYADRREAYVELVAAEMVPRAAAEGLCAYCDAYCEDGAFTRAEVERIFVAARAAGLGLRLHAEQFTDQRGAELAAAMGAASADHLEAISPEAVAAIAAAGTTAVLLPGAALACRCPWPPARDLLDAGANVALGTDLNPGSSMTSSLPLMMSLACMQMGMSCEESWRAVTRAPAASLGLDGRCGRLAAGAQADLVIFEAPDYRYVPYHYGDNHARVVVKSGHVVVNRWS